MRWIFANRGKNMMEKEIEKAMLCDMHFVALLFGPKLVKLLAHKRMAPMTESSRKLVWESLKTAAERFAKTTRPTAKQKTAPAQLKAVIMIAVEPLLGTYSHSMSLMALGNGLSSSTTHWGAEPSSVPVQ